MTLRDDHHATRERSRDEQCPTIGQEAQERSHVGRGRHHRPRGVRRAGGRCQGGVDPGVGSAGLDAHRGVARRGSDSAGGRALRPQRPVSRWAPSWQQPRDGRVGRPARADSRAPDSPCHGARDSTAVVRGAAWRSRSQRPVAEARAVWDLVPQLRGGRRGDSRGDRPVGVDGVPRVHSGQRDQTPRTSGAGPLRGGRRGPRAGRQDVRRGDDGRRRWASR